MRIPLPARQAPLSPFPNASQQLPKSHVPRHLGSQNMSVEQKADQALQFLPIPVGDRNPQHYVFPFRVAVKESVESRGKHGEQSRLRSLAEIAQGAGEV